jgi:hypothetical protein
MNTALKRLLVWSPAIALILSAAAVPGGIALFFAPLLGLGYLIFAIVASLGAEPGR